MIYKNSGTFGAMSILALYVLNVSILSDCYAAEITAKYNRETASFEQPGADGVTFVLKSKGIRKIGSNAIITNWPEHQLDDDSAPNGAVIVRSKCTPSITKTYGDMTNMTPNPQDLSTGELVCSKGQGIAVFVLDPTTPDYEYVADLTVIKDSQPATNTTTLYPVLNAQQQLNPKGMEIKTNANPAAAAVQQKGSCKCILM